METEVKFQDDKFKITDNSYNNTTSNDLEQLEQTSNMHNVSTVSKSRTLEKLNSFLDKNIP